MCTTYPKLVNLTYLDKRERHFSVLSSLQKSQCLKAITNKIYTSPSLLCNSINILFCISFAY